jgi:hypothetical protein
MQKQAEESFKTAQDSIRGLQREIFQPIQASAINGDRQGTGGTTIKGVYILLY